ncbi:isoaspartyl peptidase/L-asparaginase family protein [Taibaiella koreensis]|uniref:isoaspartyl peptidase/L-asparaginase family protein n=1 Tax=Taibaiella koreensis TaxID=1268548 RepID=UPI000E5A099A|nr:isoaspartyl peptidase/L-asparaginase [Taibaiella koreensis]
MFSIAIHGGAGTIARHLLDREKQVAYEAGLNAALDAGYALLEAGGSALDAVTAAVVSLEDCPLFNAGKGSVFNHEGRHEMDASIMRGDTREAGAVAGIQGVKNPVLLAREVMTHSEHVLLSGAGAAAFARRQGLAFMPDDYFYDAFRYQQYQEALSADRVQLDHSASGDRKFSTVGAVALDSKGNLCAATSTGGMTNKKYGRIGDTPVIGAGTYASNATCAVSCTGHGELFLRQVVAHQVHCLMAYKECRLEEACRQVVMTDLVAIGGEGGLIAVDAHGNIAMPFNSEGMYRAWRSSNGYAGVAIHT